MLVNNYEVKCVTETFKYYNTYNYYNNYKMENTTIALSKELKEKISEFGNKGESFSDILQRMYNSAVQRQLNDFLFNEKGFIPIEEAMAEAKKKWPKSR
ncbi:Uncharacterised protein [uncultured archaeon]|nr:Uncharacterised protein [uncultured archaeon]